MGCLFQWVFLQVGGCQTLLWRCLGPLCAMVGFSQGTSGRGDVFLLRGVSLLPPPAEIPCGKLDYHVQKHHKPHSFQWGLWLAQRGARTAAAPVAQD